MVNQYSALAEVIIYNIDLCEATLAAVTNIILKKQVLNSLCKLITYNLNVISAKLLWRFKNLLSFKKKQLPYDWF